MGFSIEGSEEEKKRDQRALFLKAMRRGQLCVLCRARPVSRPAQLRVFIQVAEARWWMPFQQVDSKVNSGEFCWQYVYLFAYSRISRY